MKCFNCQKEIVDDSLYCSFCGKPTSIVPDYNVYEDDNLNVVLEAAENALAQKVKEEEAIKEDKLPWIHVSELKYWNGEYTKLYNVNYIPQNLFVDQEGKIIARKISEEEIETLLKERLN